MSARLLSFHARLGEACPSAPLNSFVRGTLASAGLTLFIPVRCEASNAGLEVCSYSVIVWSGWVGVLSEHGEALLPMVQLSEQSKLAVDELIDVLGVPVQLGALT